MVSLSQRSELMNSLSDDADSRFAYQLIFGVAVADEARTSHPADRIALALSQSDRNVFVRVVDELDARNIKPHADWILNDFLIFTLLVGHSRFDYGGELVERLLQARSPAGNELASSVERVFSAVHSGALSIEGDLAFVKVVFSDLAGCLDLDVDSVKGVYRELTETRDIDALPPFLQMLAYRAFDLIVTESVENRLNSVADIAKAIESRAEEFSLRQVFQILFSFRPATLWWMGATLVAVITASFWLGDFVGSPREQDGQEKPATDVVLDKTVR